MNHNHTHKYKESASTFDSINGMYNVCDFTVSANKQVDASEFFFSSNFDVLMKSIQ